MKSRLPAAIAESTIRIAGVIIRVVTLEDGRRIITGEDLAAVLDAFDNGEVLIEDEILALARMLKGTADGEGDSIETP